MSDLVKIQIVGFLTPGLRFSCDKAGIEDMSLITSYFLFDREAVADSSGVERKTTDILEEDMVLNADQYNPTEVSCYYTRAIYRNFNQIYKRSCRVIKDG